MLKPIFLENKYVFIFVIRIEIDLKSIPVLDF